MLPRPTARADRLVAKVASAMMFRAGGMPAHAAAMPFAPLTRYILFEILLILGESIERDQRPHQFFEFAQRHHVGTIRRRVIGIGMGFDEHAGDADRNRSARMSDTRVL